MQTANRYPLVGINVHPSLKGQVREIEAEPSLTPCAPLIAGEQMAGCAVLVVPAVGNAGKRSDIDSEDLIYSIPEPEAGECASASGFFFVFISV